MTLGLRLILLGVTLFALAIGQQTAALVCASMIVGSALQQIVDKT